MQEKIVRAKVTLTDGESLRYITLPESWVCFGTRIRANAATRENTYSARHKQVETKRDKKKRERKRESTHYKKGPRKGSSSS